MVNDDNDALRSSIHRSLVDLSSSSSQAEHVCVFWRVWFGGGCILSKSGLLLLISSTLPTLPLRQAKHQRGLSNFFHICINTPLDFEV